MDNLETLIEIDRFYHRKKVTLISIIIIFELLFLIGIGISIYFLVAQWPYAPLFLVSMIIHLVLFPYLASQFISMLITLIHYGFLYRAKVRFLVYEIILMVVLELLIWALSAVFIPALAAIYYLALPSLCSIIIAIILERYTMKELLLQIKKSNRQVIYYSESGKM